MIEARGGIESLHTNWRLELVAFLYVKLLVLPLSSLGNYPITQNPLAN